MICPTTQYIPHWDFFFSRKFPATLKTPDARVSVERLIAKTVSFRSRLFCTNRTFPDRSDALSFVSSLLWLEPVEANSSDDNNKSAALWAGHQWNAEWLENTTRLRTFIPDIGNQPTGMALPRTVWVRLNRLRTGVGRFRSCLYKWGMVRSAACQCSAEEQIVEYVVLHLPIHLRPYGAHGLTVLDDETTEWLLNTCPEIWCGQAVDCNNRLEQWRSWS